MATAATTLDVQSILSFPFRDPQWKNKLALGSLLIFLQYMIPILPLIFVLGYSAEIMRRVIIHSGEPTLPEWDGWEGKLKDGLKLFGVQIIYFLPLILVAIVMAGVWFSLPFLSVFLASSGERAAAWVSLIFLLGSLAWLPLIGLSIIFTILAGIALPPAMMHVIATGEFAAGFRVRQWWAILRANLAGFVTAYIVTLGTSMILIYGVQLLYFTVVLCCLMPFVIAPVSMYIAMLFPALFGGAYRTGAAKLKATAEAASLDES